MAPTFPLPMSFFRAPVLQAREKEFLHNAARANSIDVIARTKLEDGPFHWEVHAHDNEQVIYRGHDAYAPHGVQTFLGVMEIKATLDEVAQLYACHKEDDIAEFRRTIAKDTLDTQQLYVLAEPTPSNPRHFIGVKWSVIQSPAPALIRHRDWVFLESHYDFDLDGRRGWARSTKSIELPFLPSLESSLEVVRAFQLRAGFVFIESDRPGYLNAMQLHQFDLRGKVPAWMIAFGIKKRCRVFLELAKYVRENRLSNSKFLASNELVPTEYRTHCLGCRKKFRSFVSRKGNCQKCGEVFCLACSTMWAVKLSGMRHQLRVCKRCSVDTNMGHTDSTYVISSNPRDNDGGSVDRAKSYTSSSYRVLTPGSSLYQDHRHHQSPYVMGTPDSSYGRYPHQYPPTETVFEGSSSVSSTDRNDLIPL
ncbi:Aste57867_11122 [Aphanomyces stellatus]|uniref:Aste57867_11122 protein n=1 Tax=Aphanomyces stellatus TaxID=120398 RepID=A0A485KSI2_9STRA|nr:hypothetical protein As57867_011080 [Aphanomyces stellatus]VFT87989.1 Aste57867_11122 [Aphanomyces stellatus]